jgi:glucosamine-6-phosphate deaminase
MTTKPVFTTTIDMLPVSIYASNAGVGQAAAQDAAAFLQETLRARGQENVILATVNSQLTFL